ncbi:carbohydrate ABC transporter permease [Longispora albida]|uniref:carbohydrate ABC transporter permease n=1 Tax=Longispora albida TaxID=203523 RepID=UPI000380B1CF|nr:carbohydrate ABC transporter permease [Longispora albida]
MRASRSEIVLRYLLLVLVFLISIGPFAWQLATSLKSPAEDIYTYPPQFLPSDPTLDNYVKVGEIVPVWRYAINSLLVGVASVVSNCLFAAMGGYALARFTFRGRRLATWAFLATLLIPGEAVLISMFLTVRSMGLADTLTGVWLPGCAGAINVLLLRNAFLALPREVEEAAVVDGAHAWQRFRRVALPSVKGTLAVVALLSFMAAWDDFLWPLIILSDPDKYTLTVGLQYLSGTFSNDQRLVAAGTMISVLPLLALFFSLQRFFFKGLGEGALKG